MKVWARLNSFEQLEFAITINAPVEDWRDALKQLEKLNEYGHIPWPLGGFADCIKKMLNDLDKTHADVLLKEPE